MKKILLLVSCLWTASAFADGLPTTPYIYVLGSAEEHVDPDLLTLRFEIRATDKDQAKAKTIVAEKSATVFKLFRTFGISDEAITAFKISIAADYDDGDRGRTFLGYQINRDFTVRLTDFTLYPKVLNGLLEVGIEGMPGVEPSYTKSAALGEKLKSRALINAREQADGITPVLNAKVNSVFAVSPIPFNEISRAIFGSSESYAAASLGRDKGGVPGDIYAFEKLKLVQYIHVIFLIEPNKK